MKQVPMAEADFKALSHCLPQIEIFAPLPLTEMERLIRTIQLWTVDAGECVFKQGSAGDGLFVIYEGTVMVKQKRGFMLPARKVATLGPRQFFGEMSMLDRRPHSATVQALTPAKFFVVLASAFELLCDGVPSFKSEIRAIAERRQFQNMHKR